MKDLRRGIGVEIGVRVADSLIVGSRPVDVSRGNHGGRKEFEGG